MKRAATEHLRQYLRPLRAKDRGRIAYEDQDLITQMARFE
jgi:hypothetical protein